MLRPTLSNNDLSLSNNIKKGSPSPVEDLRGACIFGDRLDLPLAFIKENVLLSNSKWMSSYLSHPNVLFAPHGKTTMAPQLFELQIADGAWAITLATIYQVRVAYSFNIKTIFFANELVGRAEISYIYRLLDSDPHFNFYCLVDNLAAAQAIDQYYNSHDHARRLDVLIEIGYPGGRTGCRSSDEAMSIAAYIHESSSMNLVGVEGYEGLIRSTNSVERIAAVQDFLDRIGCLANEIDALDYFDSPVLYLSAGGSEFYDLVLRSYESLRFTRPYRIIIRSGCYLTSDSSLYKRIFSEIRKRNPDIAPDDIGLNPSLFVAARVVSMPEPGLLIANMGKRDITYDDPPVLLGVVHFDDEAASTSMTPFDARVTGFNDQHCYLSLDGSVPGLRPGDVLLFGISHPCLTFDKWSRILLVDDLYMITGCIDTYF